MHALCTEKMRELLVERNIHEHLRTHYSIRKSKAVYLDALVIE